MFCLQFFFMFYTQKSFLYFKTKAKLRLCTYPLKTLLRSAEKTQSFQAKITFCSYIFRKILYFSWPYWCFFFFGKIFNFFQVHIHAFCIFLFLFHFYFRYFAFIFWVIFITLCFNTISLGETRSLSNPELFIVCSSIQFFRLALLFWTQSAASYLVTYNLLCSNCITYGTPFKN